MPRHEQRGLPTPPVSDIAGMCDRCGHSQFVHSDRDDHPCLYNECFCSDRWTNVTVMPKDPAMQGERSRRPTEMHLVASRAGSIIAVTLAPQVAAQRAARLSAAGWEVRLEHGGDVA
jgi:hypothetical protein